MKTRTHLSPSLRLLSRGGLASAAFLLACVWPQVSRAQDDSTNLTGTFAATETWTVTIAEDNGQTPTFSKTYHGTTTGTLAINNGNYDLINKTGIQSSKIVGARTIYGNDGVYSIYGDYPVTGFAGDYALVELSFFVIKLKLPVTDYAIPALSGGGNDEFYTSGSLDDLTGSGDETDENTGFTASASSTSSLRQTGTGTGSAGKPKITLQPKSQTVAEGNEAVFNLGADSDTSLSYQWQFDGADLSDTDYISGSQTSELTIYDVGSGNVGKYTVIVSNAAGSVTSKAASLKLAGETRPQITEQPESQTAVSGNEVSFYVGAESDSPLYYQWKHDGKYLTDNGNVSGSATAQLTIADVEAGDGGAYSVVVSNDKGSVTSHAATLKLEVTPYIIKEPSDQTVLSGHDAVFTVQAGGTPPLHYQWFQNDIPLSNGDGVSGARTARLVIRAEAADSGSYYSVEVSHGADYATYSDSASLTVE
jgi:hypothetical protein